MMKKVLLITYYFPPYAGGGVYRLLKFAKYLPEFSWQPIIITSKPKKYYWCFDNSLLKEIPRTAKIHRTWSVEPFYLLALLEKLKLLKIQHAFKDYFLIPDEKIGWILSALLKCLTIIRQEHIDVILTSSPPQSAHLIGYILKKLTKIPWILDFRDQWTFNPEYGPASKIIDALNKGLEQKVRKSSDRIVHVTYGAKYKISKRFKINEDKIVTITNGYDREDFSSVGEIDKPNSNFVLAYFGNLYGGRSPENLFKGIKIAAENNPDLARRIKFLFFGSYSPNLVTSFNKSGLDQIVQVKGFVPHAEAIKNMLMSDVLVLILPHRKSDENVVTGKVFEYMASQKPILALVPDGEAKQILRKANLGIFPNPSSPEDIAQVIGDLFDKWSNNQLIANPNNEFIENFERRKLTKELTSILEEVTQWPI